MKLFSSLLQIPLGILSVNIKMLFWPFNGREASRNNLAPEMIGSREKFVCLSGCLLMTTEGLLCLVFREVSAFLFLCMTFSDNHTISVYSIFPGTSLIFWEVGFNNWWQFGKKFVDIDWMIVTLCLYFLSSIKL